MPPALLLGGLNLVRALGLARIPVIVASAEGDNPAFASRFCTRALVLPPPERRTELLDALMCAGERAYAEAGERVPLFYGDDDMLALVHAERQPLERWFAFLLNEPATAAALLDKGRFQTLARARRLPVPRALKLSELAQHDGPVIVKPRSKAGWENAAVHRDLMGAGAKARRFSSGRAALAHPLVARYGEELAFQEYIDGDDRELWSFHGFAARDGTMLASFTGRKLRTYPALVGESSFIELVPNADLERAGREIAERLELKGVFKMDLKRDRAGRFHLLEINARYNLWHYLGAKNGVNLPAIAYRYLRRGERPERATAGSLYRWLCPRLDWPAYREAAARREITLARYLASLLERPKVYDLFSWTDPRPFVQRYVRKARAVPRVTRRLLTRWLSTAS
jgi:predicted ATP-grasp superfamily ATP-dependent carboligase